MARLQAVPAAEHSRVCDAATWVETTLGRCGIIPLRGYIVRYVREVRNDYGNCIFGRFRANPDVAAVVGPSATAALVAAIPDSEPMSIYKSLPADDLHRSLIVHEIGHVIVHQNLKVAPCHAIHEYVAAVVQIGALSETSRKMFLARFAGEDRYTEEMFNDMVQAMNPARYAAAAYRHFHRPGNGCAFVRRLLTEPGTVPAVP